VLEELAAYEDRWQHHYDVMLHQEATLVDLLVSRKVDVFSLAEYQYQSDEEPAAAAVAAVTLAAAPRRACDGGFVFTEGVTEQPVSNLPELAARAAADPAVARYDARDDIRPLSTRDDGDESRQLELYPPSFENIIPHRVIKALYYARFVLIMMMVKFSEYFEPDFEIF